MTGAGLAAGGVVSVTDTSGPTATGLAVLGVVLGLALVAGAVFLYRSDVRRIRAEELARQRLATRRRPRRPRPAGSASGSSGLSPRRTAAT